MLKNVSVKIKHVLKNKGRFCICVESCIEFLCGAIVRECHVLYLCHVETWTYVSCDKIWVCLCVLYYF